MLSKSLNSVRVQEPSRYMYTDPHPKSAGVPPPGGILGARGLISCAVSAEFIALKMRKIIIHDCVMKGHRILVVLVKFCEVVRKRVNAHKLDCAQFSDH